MRGWRGQPQTPGRLCPARPAPTSQQLKCSTRSLAVRIPFIRGPKPNVLDTPDAAEIVSQGTLEQWLLGSETAARREPSREALKSIQVREPFLGFLRVRRFVPRETSCNSSSPLLDFRSRGLRGATHRDCQPKGWGRKNNHGGQSLGVSSRRSPANTSG